MTLHAKAKHKALSAIQAGPVPLRVIQDLRYETHLAAVRTRRRLFPSVRSSERILKGMRDIKLHFGCGPRILPGWVNIDGWTFPGVDFTTDLRQPLPLSDGSCRLIFTEHVFEHIDPDFRLPVLREFIRVLQPGGTLRLVVPDCEKFVAAYLRRDEEWFHISLGYPAGAAEGLNKVFTMHTHRFIDDWNSLSSLLRAAGFGQVERSMLNGSVLPDLRIDNEESGRASCSLYAEARR